MCFGPEEKWHCKSHSHVTNFFFSAFTHMVAGKKGSILSYSLINTKNCLGHKLKPCQEHIWLKPMDDSIVVLKPLQSLSFLFPAGTVRGFFPLLIQYFILLLLLEVLVITEMQQCLFQFCSHLFLKMASESYLSCEGFCLVGISRLIRQQGCQITYSLLQQHGKTAV